MDTVMIRPGKYGHVAKKQSPHKDRIDVIDQIGPHIIYTKRTQKLDSEDTKYLLQGRCMVCKRETSSMCSEYNEDRENEGPETKTRCPWICDTKSDRDFFRTFG